MQKNILLYLKIIPKGFSQIMLQNNAVTGLLFLAGIFYNSRIMGIGALIGVITSTVAAMIFRFDKRDITDGQYGFNGALVGIALFFFYQANVISVILIIVGSILSVLIMDFMHKRKMYPYTFPFVLSTWIIMGLIRILSISPMTAHELSEASRLNITSSLSLGFGQVMFQASIMTGVIFFIAIAINSRRSALYALLGSLMGVAVAGLFSLPLDLINAGIFGYNAVLCGIAFANIDKHAFYLALISIVFSIFIVYGMMELKVVALTAPFVFATWIILVLSKGFNRIALYETQR
ncbi:MAG: urea transporter [Patescibacteria group bacterium]|nr:urea transporter [Patescibacteria group bacterium]